MAKETKVETPAVAPPTEAEIKRSLEVLAFLNAKQEAEKAAKLEASKDDEMAAFKRDYDAVQAWIKKGIDNPGWLARELKMSINRAEAILRKIGREKEVEKEKEFLKIPGIPN